MTLVSSEARPRRRRPCVSFFVHDLAGNPIARTAPLPAALADDFDVEVLGLLLSGSEVYGPFRDRFVYRTPADRSNVPSILAARRRLASSASGDLLFARKPPFSTLWPALQARGGRSPRPVLPDVEDDEWGSRAVGDQARRVRGMARRAADTHRFRARLAHPLTRRVDGVTVARRPLQERYGGVLVRHGPDEAAFDPARPELHDRRALRREFCIPEGRRVAVFAGGPRPHKGWDVLLDALQRPEAAAWDLVAAGGTGHAGYAAARARLVGRFHALGVIPNSRMPALLAIADAVPVRQKSIPFAESQLPAKALEAMAVAVPAVGTLVGDVPEIPGRGERGWLVPPADAPVLVGVQNRAGAARRGRAAREWFVAGASQGAIRTRLLRMVEEGFRRARAERG